MLTHLYIEALLVDEDLADQVWEAWNRREIDDSSAWMLWLHIAVDGTADKWLYRVDAEPISLRGLIVWRAWCCQTNREMPFARRC